MRLTILFPILLFASGCQTHADDQCWLPETKQKAEEVAHQLLESSFVASAKATWPTGEGKKAFGDKEEEALKEMLHISLSDFHQISKDKESGSYHCGASAQAVLNVKDGNVLESAKSIIEFNVNRGEQGYVVSMTLAGGLLAVEQSLADAVNGLP